ncbi:MAG: hypothetical protein F4228_09325 [Acidobacteria bacterium]|nr:hypothetical protein [Acidobacteriota bacterium]MYF14891.1 hypothetical protein [Acidobacteriota bacterium]
MTHLAPLFPEGSDGSGREGLVRIVNYSGDPGVVRITAVDEDGRDYGPAALAIGAGQTIHLTPEDLARGNPAKGVSGAIGSGWGGGRLELSSDLDLMALSYVRHRDGFVTAMHELVPREGGRYHVRTFHPGSEPNQTSRLRLINTGPDQAAVRIRGIDDRGVSGGQVTASVPAGATREFTAAALESGAGVNGSLGHGAGRWRLIVESDNDLVVQNLSESPAGHLMDLSAAPRAKHGAWTVPLFPGATDPSGRRGLLRIVNRSDRGGAVRIAAFDDSGRRYPTFTTRVGAGQAVYLDSGDLEAELSPGAGSGNWRLVASGEPEIEVLSYVQQPDGLLSPMHDVAPLEGHRVSTFLPGGRLRLVNVGETVALVTVATVDDRGSSSGGAFGLTLPAGAARELTAAELGFGGDSGSRRLVIDSEGTVEAMSLLEGPAGRLANLSSEPRRDPAPVEDRYVETYRGNPAGVTVSVVDGEGFDPGDHGQRITDTFLDRTRYAALLQIGGRGEYALNGSLLGGGNMDGYIIHALTRGGGVFWSATNSGPLYFPGETSTWFEKHGRPFTRAAREFASWMRDRDALFIGSVENPTCFGPRGRCVPVYCDDFELYGELDGGWIPQCGELADYVAHSGVGLDNVLFAGALDLRFGIASGAIRADGVFQPHTIYVESPDGSTSHATAVLAAYAVNLAFGNPSWSAARLKRELMALAREETVDYDIGASTEQGAIVTERRSVRTIRPRFAP